MPGVPPLERGTMHGKKSQASGQAPAPSKLQKRKPRKPRAVRAAENVGDRVVKVIESLNPFD